MVHRAGDDPRTFVLRQPDEAGAVHEDHGSFDAVTPNAIVFRRAAGHAPPPPLPAAATAASPPQPETESKSRTYAAGKMPRKRVSTAAVEPEELRRLEEIRKEKNRIKQRRHYHKKRDLVKKVMPAEMAERESDFEQRVVAFLGDGKSIQRTKQELLMADDSELSIAGKSREEQAQTLCRVKLLQAALLEYNERSVTELERRRAFSRQIQDELDELHGECNEIEGNKAPSDQELNKYAFILSKALKDIDSLMKNEKFTTFRGCIHGWQETRIVESDLFSWSMQKIITAYPPDVLAQRTWEICTDPVRWGKLFSPVTEMVGRRVKHMSANQVLMSQQYLGMKPAGGGNGNYHQLRVKTLSLVSRLTTSKGGLMTIICGLPSDQIFPSGRGGLSASGKNNSTENEVWNDLFCWMEAKSTGESPPDTVCRFSGFCPTLRDRASEQFWMNEVISLARNWEKMALGGSGTDRATP